ncbi:hypothetical protein Salat_2133400 [Sesamum alatum]|uniref:Uncharacterized protein n=1 Tax=Sesamum alatum TaxID=300844 RepID=A0AAE1Y2D4_9LAMI|nr:hypothetical protein Salat_2133400 [Sesamum alatum]
MVADKAEEVENLQLIRELTEWWKGAHEELRTSKCVSVEMEGDKLVPNWVISEQSSVLKTHAMGFGHHLNLKCTYWRREKFLSDTKLVDALKKLEESREAGKEEGLIAGREAYLLGCPQGGQHSPPMSS